MSTEGLQNHPETGGRDARTDNKFGLQTIDHQALPTRNMALMERFLREVLGGEPFYYAGFDETDRQMGRRPHIFCRVGNVLFQFTEEKDAVLNTKDDVHISPHTAFRVSPADMDNNIERLRGLGIPVQGPFRHRDGTSISCYFQSPEGHKLELVTWEDYPAEKCLLIGENGVRVIWPELANSWPNAQ